MDEVDVERGIATEQQMLASRLRSLQAGLAPNQKPVTECVECGGEIPEARRRVAPHARRCVDCQRMAERQ